MAAPKALRSCRWLLPPGCRGSSSGVSAPHWPRRALRSLAARFSDVESLLGWGADLARWNLRRKNAYYGYTKSLYGENVAASYYVLNQKGGVRFQGQDSWIRANWRGHFSWDFLQFKDVPLEAVDVSGSTINYEGLENLVRLKRLECLRLNDCTHIDDWCLSRLYVFQDSLRELSLSGCPQITERGLAALHPLKNLRHLDLSNLPSVDNRGLLRILLEEILPQCQVVGIDYEDGLETERGKIGRAH
ncbi:distal membrane-arm assembly complex protein 2, partial [Callorhinchus milii]|uniref:distal membrane-arm assembly complex protein 2 n=1 Tax=Callorhinchus milii TaxID=7868 RepID=UPI001C3F6FEB